jgi:hypothetical protein
VVLGAGVYGGLRYFQREKPGAAATSVAVKTETAGPELITVAPDVRYAKLVRPFTITEAQLAPMFKPENREAGAVAFRQLMKYELADALIRSSGLVNSRPDAGVLLVNAMCLTQMHLISDGYRAMLKSEAFPPGDPLRCWAMFNMALAVADQKVIEREAEHLAADPAHGKEVAEVMQKVRGH